VRAIAPAILVLALLLPAGAGAKVRAPKGDYTGPRDLFMRISDKTIEIAGFNFPCPKHPKAHGRTSLTSIPLKKTDKGYKLSSKEYGIVSYSNNSPDQNGVTSISGQFGPRGGFVRGRFLTTTRYCGATDKLDWKANRTKGQAR
jgi:hypothetical protein